jgi:N-acetylmuramoyl-L-alanine amidase
MRFVKIAIDKGHNAPPDTGAVANSIRECDIVDKVGERLIQLLEQTSLRPVRVNPAKAFSVNDSLTKRVTMANQSGAGLYLSLHCNAAGAAQAKGVECFHFAGNTVGKELSELLSSELSGVLETNNRGAKVGNFFVLRRTNMTAVLLEIGFLTNKAEAKKISESIEEIAQCIFECLCTYNEYKPTPACREIKPGFKTEVLEHIESTDEIDYSIFNKDLGE